MEKLSAFFNWIYQFPVGTLCRLVVVLTLVLFFMHQRLENRRWWRWVLAAALAAWFAVTLWSTVLSRGGSADTPFQLIPFHSLREVLKGGNPELLRSCLMNVVLFYPGGLLFALSLPEKWPSGRRFLVLTAVLGLYSLSIELVQYRFSLGRAEIDDVLHNTLGAVFGYAATRLESGSFTKHSK